MPDFETSLLHAIGVILHQVGDVVIRHRAAISALRQVGENLLRAGFGRFGFVFGRIADEDAVAAGRGTEAFGIEGTQQLERVDAVQTILTAAGRKHLQLIVGLSETLAAESDADAVRPGGGREI